MHKDTATRVQRILNESIRSRKVLDQSLLLVIVDLYLKMLEMSHKLLVDVPSYYRENVCDARVFDGVCPS